MGRAGQGLPPAPHDLVGPGPKLYESPPQPSIQVEPPSPMTVVLAMVASMIE